MKLRSGFYTLLSIAIALSGSFARADDGAKPALSKERIVFTTQYGDLVFALYPGAAPNHYKHILQLTSLGVYDGAQAFRIIPNFIIQFSEIHQRADPLSGKQADAAKPIKAETSNSVKHLKWRLTLARYDDKPDSGISSFSILLGNATHLDGGYTVFGELESGGNTINKILAVPRTGVSPTTPIMIRKAFVVSDPAAYYGGLAADPLSNAVTEVAVAKAAIKVGAKPNITAPDYLRPVVILLIVIVLVSLAGFFLREHMSKNRLVSLLLVNVLVSGFGLLMILTPQTESSPWLAIVLFFGIFAMLRLMSQFEKNS